MKFIYVLLSFFFLTPIMDAQEKEARRSDMDANRYEKIESMKIAFITQKLDLTASEAQKFWPIYNQFSDEMKELRGDRTKRDGTSSELSDNDAKKLIAQKIANEKMKHQKMENLVRSLEGVISPQKTLKFMRIEQEFKSKMLGKVKEKMDRKREYKQEMKN